MILRGEEISTPLSVEQVSGGRSWQSQGAELGRPACPRRRWTPGTPWPWPSTPSVSTGSSAKSTAASGAERTSSPSASWTSLASRTSRCVWARGGAGRHSLRRHPSVCSAGQPLRAVQHQLRQREAAGILQQAHLLAGAARVQQVGGERRGGGVGRGSA